MQMTFNEKSAWIMLAALLVSGLSYAGAVVNLSADLGQLAPPSVPLLIKFTVLLIVISIVGHALIAALRPGESSDRLDEREKRVHDKAGNWSGFVLGAGVITALMAYLMLGQGDLLFYGVLASLVVAQLAEYVLQLAMMRLAS